MEKIQKVQGNKSSDWVTIPKKMGKLLGITRDDKVKVEMIGKRLIITKEAK